MLKDEADAALLGALEGHVLVGDDDLAGVGALEAGDDAQQGRLARAARPQQGGETALGDLEVDVLERLEVAEALGHAVGLDPHAISLSLLPRTVMTSSTSSESTASSVLAE